LLDRLVGYVRDGSEIERPKQGGNVTTNQPCFRPRVAVWEITRACNLSCGHCGTGAGAPREGELTREEALDVVHQLAALGNQVLTLSGGEPTIRPDWPDLAAAAAAAGINVNMVTNGQSAEPEQLAQEVCRAGLCNVGVSLDGLEATHDQLRRPGAFRRACTTVMTLAEAGIWVDVMVTVNRLNLKELPELYALVDRLGAQGLRCQLGKPMGNQTDRKDLTLQRKEMLQLLPLLNGLACSPGPVVRLGDSVGHFSPFERHFRGDLGQQYRWQGCGAGRSAIGIQADGSIKGCLSLQPRAGEADRFIEGNVRDLPLAELWHRPGAFAQHRDWNEEMLQGPCASCGHRLRCRGGASCAAHAWTGKLGNNPMCYAQIAREDDSWRKNLSHAAAAAAVVLSLGGCATHQAQPGATTDSGSPDSATAADGSPHDGAATGDGGTPDSATGDTGNPGSEGDSGRDCSEVQCEHLACPDYGVSIPCQPVASREDYLACCCDEVACENPCPMCDYGIWPPDPVAHEWCCSDPSGNDER
jgi:MoaA/NifB/PqqE/SkfB family radical SAM enzyme